jgi:hypothetical protein
VAALGVVETVAEVVVKVHKELEMTGVRRRAQGGVSHWRRRSLMSSRPGHG